MLQLSEMDKYIPLGLQGYQKTQDPLEKVTKLTFGLKGESDTDTAQ